MKIISFTVGIVIILLSLQLLTAYIGSSECLWFGKGKDIPVTGR
jgi:hypothetical protein